MLFSWSPPSSSMCITKLTTTDNKTHTFSSSKDKNQHFILRFIAISAFVFSTWLFNVHLFIFTIILKEKAKIVFFAELSRCLVPSFFLLSLVTLAHFDFLILPLPPSRKYGICEIVRMRQQ